MSETVRIDNAKRQRADHLNCLLDISRLVEEPGISLPEILQGTVQLLPPAWNYPEIAGACIVLDDREFRTANYDATAPWCQSADLLVHAQRQGAIRVCYLEERPQIDEGPFASAERELLDAVAERLGRIIERMRAQEELRWNKVILSSIADPIFFVDRNYAYCFVNETYSRYVKMARQEIIGRTVAELLGAKTFREFVRPHLDRCFAGQDIHYRAWFDFPDKVPKYLDVSYYPVYDESGAVIGAVANSRDITEQARLHEQVERYAAELERRVAERTAELEASQMALLQAERLTVVGKLAASLTHEISNPLQSVIGCLGLAEEARAEGQDVDEYLQIALTELRRVARIVARLRNLGRPPSALVVKEPTDLGAVLDQAVSLCRKKCQEQGIQIENRVEEALPLLPLVPDQIEQVLLNLMLNAIDAMPDGGRLSIYTSSSETPAGLRISFVDTGAGIPADVLSHIFDPFYSTKPENLGVGLSICQDIVEAHGGHISVESQPGEGSRFTVWLPV